MLRQISDIVCREKDLIKITMTCSIYVADKLKRTHYCNSLNIESPLTTLKGSKKGWVLNIVVNRSEFGFHGDGKVGVRDKDLEYYFELLKKLAPTLHSSSWSLPWGTPSL